MLHKILRAGYFIFIRLMRATNWLYLSTEEESATKI
jgi:hypothetical protein